MKKTLRYLQKLSDEFWDAYKSEMLHNLLKSNTWNAEEENVSIGDIVLVEFNSMLDRVYRIVQGRSQDCHGEVQDPDNSLLEDHKISTRQLKKISGLRLE